MAKKPGKTNGAGGGAEQSAPAAAPPSSGALPLFFQKPHPLEAPRHARAAVRPGGDYAFARRTNSLPLNAIEFIEAMKHYPIVFTPDKENPLPAAIVGLEQENYFVQPGGGWRAEAYVPAYARQYPFVFFEQPEEKKFYLCIDEGADAYSAEAAPGALALYTPEGKPSEIAGNALQFCTAFYNHFLITKNFCADLKKHKLLMPYQSEVRLADGRTVKLAGFQMIDEKALSRLPEKIFLEFRTKGWLPFIYFALASASNWKRLADLAAENQGSKAA